MIVIQRRFSNVIVTESETSPTIEAGMAHGGGASPPMILQEVKGNVFCSPEVWGLQSIGDGIGNEGERLQGCD